MLLKDYISVAYCGKIAQSMADCLPGFPEEEFLGLVLDEFWDAKALKQRGKHIASCLHHFLPQPFSNAASVLVEWVKIRLANHETGGIEALWLPDYIELFGTDDPQAAFAAMEWITCYFSCEFAIRVFWLHFPEQTFLQSLAWAKHANPAVRRLASEGSRPKLPWGMKVEYLLKHPEKGLVILELLKEDPSEFVRRSVANHINDLSKEHPQVVYELMLRWQQLQSPETNWILKHGARTLLKKGNLEVMSQFGFEQHSDLQTDALQLEQPLVRIGGDLHFVSVIRNLSALALDVRAELVVYFPRNQRPDLRKVFQLGEKKLQPNEEWRIHRKQHFKPIRTRTYYPGLHRIALQVNGKEQDAVAFELQA